MKLLGLIFAVILVILSCGVLVQGQEDGVELYMLAFMNISTDKPSLLSFQQLVLNAFDDNTRVKANTYSANVNYKGVLPPFDDGSGNVGFDFRTSVDLVSGEQETFSMKGLFVVADKKVSLQATKSVQQSTDGYQALPVTTESTEFYIMSFDEIKEGHSTYAITALFDSTCVEVYSVNGPKFTRFDIATLDAYMVYNKMSNNEDFTGIYINSTKPVSVFSGHECAQNPVGKFFCDHMQAQIPPIFEWGMEYVVPPIIGRKSEAGYVIRVITSEDNTDVHVHAQKIDFNITATIDRGIKYLDEFFPDASCPAVVICSAPCLVMQYNMGWRSLGYQNIDVKTDPFMTLIPSKKKKVPTATLR